MKLGPDMCHLNTFHLNRNRGGSEWTGVGVHPKSIKKYHEINKIWNLTSNKNSLKNAINFGSFLLSPLTIWLYCWKGTQGVKRGQPAIRGVLLTRVLLLTRKLRLYFLLVSKNVLIEEKCRTLIYNYIKFRYFHDLY